MKPEEEAARGREAQSVLNNSIYKESLVIIKAQMFDAFVRSNADQSAEREEIWRRMNNLDALEKQLTSVMTTGKLGEATLDLNTTQGDIK